MKGKLCLIAMIICINGGVETLRASLPDGAILIQAPALRPGEYGTRGNGLWGTATLLYPSTGAGDRPEMLVPTLMEEHGLALRIVDPRDCTIQ